jgi:signal transduction histidine kinase
LNEVGAGPLLTVPLVIRERLVGAVTFVRAHQGRPFSPEDIKLAEDLASRSAMALDRARTYGDAVTQKVRAEAASEAKSAFLSMMSHELRTPLNAIAGYVDLLDMELHGPLTQAQHIDLARIKSNQRYLMGLITDLLSLTRVGSGQVAYNIGNINMKEVLEASVALVEPLFARMQLVYDGIRCDDSIVARSDRERVIQILVNLLSNAIKFTPPGGRLGIDCQTTRDAVLVNVNDTGIGIPSHKLESIFEPFVQVKSDSTGAEAGIGLGLAISRSLAQAMNGDLTVESTLGEGARFTLTLPLA